MTSRPLPLGLRRGKGRTRLIEVDNIVKVFSQGKPNEFRALQGITLSIEARRVTVLKGPSGSGKTTLLTIVGCMARPTAGRVRVFGRDVTSLPERFLTEVRRRTSGFVFQRFNLIRGITSLENVMVPGYPTRAAHPELKGRALRLLDLLGVAGKAGSKVEWLSGGEAQRVAIARALINDPPVLIADEPTAHLDTNLCREFLDIVERLKGEGKTIVVASHDPLVFSSSIVDAVVELRDGHLVGGGGPR